MTAICTIRKRIQRYVTSGFFNTFTRNKYLNESAMSISGKRKTRDVSHHFGASHSDNTANKNGNVDNDSNRDLVELGRFTLFFIFGSK